MSARLTQHAVAVGNEIGGIGPVPLDAALFKSVEPVVENLHVGVQGVGCMRSPDSVLVQICESWLDELEIRREEKRESRRPRLPQLDQVRGGGCLTQPGITSSGVGSVLLRIISTTNVCTLP